MKMDSSSSSDDEEEEETPRAQQTGAKPVEFARGTL